MVMVESSTFTDTGLEFSTAALMSNWLSIAGPTAADGSELGPPSTL